MYADDLTLLPSSVQDLQVMLNTLAAYAEEKGMKVNVGKSQVVVFNAGNAAASPNLNLNGQVLEAVEDFKYLGVVFERSGGWTARGV